MKTHIKRYSRSALSILLSLCMLISCMTVGLIATNAATASEDEAVSSNDAFYLKGFVSNENNDATGPHFNSDGWATFFISSDTGSDGTVSNRLKLWRTGWGPDGWFTPSGGTTVSDFDHEYNVSQNKGDHHHLYLKSYSAGPYAARINIGSDTSGTIKFYKGVTFTEDATLYFKIDKWWNDTTCYHYIDLLTESGDTVTYKLNNLSLYKDDNSTLSSAATGSDGAVFFCTVPAGTYYGGDLQRKKTDSASADKHNQSKYFRIDTGKNLNSTGIASDGITTYALDNTKTESSDATVTASANAVKTTETVDLSVTLTNPLLNVVDYTTYAVTKDGAAAVEGTDYTLSNDVFTPLVAGEFSITGTTHYHAKGFSDLTGTATAPAVNVLVTWNKYIIDAAAKKKTFNPTTGGLNTVEDAGSGFTVNASPAEIPQEQADKTVTLTASTTASDYTFAGWYTNAACTGTPVADTASATHTATGTTTYYALFTQNVPANKYTVTAVEAASPDDGNGATFQYTGLAADGNTKAYEGATVTVKAVPGTGKKFVRWSDGDTNKTKTITNIASDQSLTAYFADKTANPITLDIVNPKLGSAELSVEEADEGDPVTVTVTTQNHATFTVTAKNEEDNPVSVTVDGDTGSFTMVGAPVTVTVTFSPYAVDANYWYDGYDSSGNVISALNSKRFTMSYYNDQPYYYYHVSRNDSGSKRFTVKNTSNGTMANAPGDTIFFLAGRNYNNSIWSDVYAKFYDSAGNELSFDKMSYTGSVSDSTSPTEGGGNDNRRFFRATVPSGAVKVQFFDKDKNSKGTFSGNDFKKGAFVLNIGSGSISAVNETWGGKKNPTMNGLSTDIDLSSYVQYNGTTDGVYVWGRGVYREDDPNRSNSYGSDVKISDKSPYAMTGDVGDYYVIILEPNTNYGKLFSNAVYDANNTSSDIKVIASSVLPGGKTTRNFKVYVQDTCWGMNDQGKIYGRAVVTSPTAAENKWTKETDESWYDIYSVKEDTQLYVTTTLTNDSFVMSSGKRVSQNMYVYGYEVNGVLYEVEETVTGSGESLTVTYVNKEPIVVTGDKIEICPIYYSKKIDADKNYIDVYVKADDAIKTRWGNVVAAYPYYYNANGTDQTGHINGHYPGQPLVLDASGFYYGRIPRYYYKDNQQTNTNKPVSGLTFSNGAEHDSSVRQKFAPGGSRNNQTYDYDDFVKIANLGYDVVRFEIKYDGNVAYVDSDNQHSNWADWNGKSMNAGNHVAQSGYTGQQPMQPLYDFDSKPCSVLGLTESYSRTIDPDQTGDATKWAPTGKSVQIVSLGNVSTTVGTWSTIWYVYDQNGELITKGHPSDFIPRGYYDSEQQKYVLYPYNDQTEGHQTSQWRKIVSDGYAFVPAQISYETETRQNASMTGVRVDGRWLYALSTDRFKVYSGVIYTDDNTSYTLDDNAVTGVTKALAKVEDGEIVDKYSSHQYTERGVTGNLSTSTSSTDYYFAYWATADVSDPDPETGKQTATNIVPLEGGKSPQTTFKASTEQRFYAVYKKIEGGKLIINHQKYTNPAYQGDGNFYVSTVLLDSAGVVKATYPKALNTVTIPNITNDMAEEGYQIKVTLYTSSVGGSLFHKYYVWDTNFISGTLDETASTNSKEDTVCAEDDPAVLENTILIDVEDLFNATKSRMTTDEVTYYSDLSGLFTGKIGIQYTNSSFDTTWKDDTSMTGDWTTTAGTVTGVDVSFVGTDPKSRMNQLASGSSFEVNKDETSKKTVYTFEGWYLRTGEEGSYTYTSLGNTIPSEDLVANSDKVYIARYRKADPTPAMNVKHILRSSLPSDCANCKVSVVVKKGTTFATGTEVYNQTMGVYADGIGIPAAYLAYAGTPAEQYWIQISLQTEPTGVYSFTGFYKEDNDSAPLTTTDATINGANAEINIFSANSLYTLDSDGNLTYNGGDKIYYSKLAKQQHTGTVIIEYRNLTSVDYHEDSYNEDGITGSTVGESVYFTNEDPRARTTTIDADGTYSFNTLSDTDDYHFDGWYISNGSGGYKLVEESDKEANADKTFIARFTKKYSAEVIIQYKDDNFDSDWVDETYDSLDETLGNTTGAKVTLDDGKRTTKLVAGSEYSYSKDDNGTSYSFVDWYVRTGTEGNYTYTKIGNGEGEITVDAAKAVDEDRTFVARYTKSASTADVDLQHILLSDSTGKGTPTVKVKVVSNDGSEIRMAETGFLDTTSAAKALSGITYRKDASDKIIITLKTAEIGTNKFRNFYSDSTGTTALGKGTESSEGTWTSSAIEVLVNDLFTVETAARTVTLNKQHLIYYSGLNSAGELTIQHLLANGNDGRGTPIITEVEVKDNAGTSIVKMTPNQGSASVSNGIEELASTNKLIVKLQTTPNTHYDFSKFTSDAAGTTEIETKSVDEHGVATITITKDVNDLFVSGALQSTLIFYSVLTPKSYTGNLHIMFRDSDTGTYGEDTYDGTDSTLGTTTGAKVTFAGESSRTTSVAYPGVYQYSADNSDLSGYIFDGWYISDGEGGYTKLTESEDSDDTDTHNVADGDKHFYALYTKAAHYKYKIIFDFKHYRDLYGSLSYITGYNPETKTHDYTLLTDDEISKYFETDTKGSGESAYETLAFKSNELMKEFLDKKAPYEDGFKEEIRWITNKTTAEDSNKGVSISYPVISGQRTGDNIQIIVKAEQTEELQVHFTVKAPYSIPEAGNGGFAPATDASGDVLKTDLKTYQPTGEGAEKGYRTAYQAVFKWSDGKEYITAPEKLKDTKGTEDPSDDTYTWFKYWEVRTFAGDDVNNDSTKVYTKCYARNFNLSFYQDSVITAVYGNSGYVAPSDQAIADDGASGTATINFMENSRSQWTGEQTSNGGKLEKLGENWKRADRIYTDFLVSFTYQDLELSTYSESGKKYGLIVEEAGSLKEMDGNTEEKINKTDYTQDQFRSKFASTEKSAALQTYITGGANNGYSKQEYSVSELDNKNRANVYTAIPNVKQSTYPDANGRNEKVYRAYSYLVQETVGEGGVTTKSILLLSNPIYFTIYDIATIDYDSLVNPKP